MKNINIAIALIAIFITTFFFVADEKSDVSINDRPLFEVTKVEPDDNYPDGSKLQLKYKDQTILISNELGRMARISANRFFIELNSYWSNDSLVSINEALDWDKKVKVIIKIDSRNPLVDPFKKFSDWKVTNKLKASANQEYFGDLDEYESSISGHLFYTVKDNSVLTPQGSPFTLMCDPPPMKGNWVSDAMYGCKYVYFFNDLGMQF